MSDNRIINDTIAIESHPLPPFLPESARILMLGSFPPQRKRWSMEFFYPNAQNDMWKLMGLIFYNDREYFRIDKAFDKERIVEFCDTNGIALYDTASQVRRLKDNASDKFLEIVTRTDITALLRQIPKCTAIVTTGQKATDVIVEQFGCVEPGIGCFTELEIAGRKVRFWRMPSTSRAYPIPLERKAEPYFTMLQYEKLL